MSVLGEGFDVEAFFDELPDGICLSDARGAILYVNPAAERILDILKPRVLGKRLCEILCGHLSVGGAPECGSTCELQRPGSSAEAVTFLGSYGPKEVAMWKDFRVQRRSVWKSLRVRCLRSSASLVGEGRHLTIIEDSSAEAEIEKQKEDWRQMIAHDLRSPLTSVYATIRLLKESAVQPLPAGGEELIGAAERSCRKMLDLITLYLDVAKLGSGVAEVKIETIRLAETVRGEIAAQEAVARDKKLAISSRVPEAIVVAGDRDLLSRVVQNLLDNAVKFTPLGGRVELSARVDAGEAELTVKDTGAGIPPEELPLLFDRYHQARARRAGKIQGNGLGLAFCREALKVMGGSVTVSSKLSEGTEFAVRLPLGDQAQAAAAGQAS